MAFELKSGLNICDVSVAFGDQHFNEESYFSGEELGFDFPDDLSVQSDVIFSIVSTSSTSSGGNETDDKSVVKSVMTKRGSKFMRKKAAPYPPKSALCPKITAIGMKTAQPNMSRRTRDAMLYVFPSFDRCDSLLFFPSTMARHTNTGDIGAIVKLFSSHCDKHCTLFKKNSPEQGMDIAALTKKMEIMDQMQPDRICCIRQTKVDGNTIRAVGYMKFTKCRAIFDAVTSTFTPDFKCFKQPWREHMLQQLEQNKSLSEVKERYQALIESNCDLVIYSRIDMEMTIDDRTKKVNHFDVTITLTSMEEANVKQELQ